MQQEAGMDYAALTVPPEAHEAGGSLRTSTRLAPSPPRFCMRFYPEGTSEGSSDLCLSASSE